jgi:hypothetical protein
MANKQDGRRFPDAGKLKTSIMAVAHWQLIVLETIS